MPFSRGICSEVKRKQLCSGFELGSMKLLPVLPYKEKSQSYLFIYLFILFYLQHVFRLSRAFSGILRIFRIFLRMDCWKQIVLGSFLYLASSKPHEAVDQSSERKNSPLESMTHDRRNSFCKTKEKKIN